MNWILCEDPGSPTVALPATGEVHTNEEAQVYVRDLNLFVTVQLLQETPAVLSRGKLCEDHGYSYEWVSGQKPRLVDDRKDSDDPLAEWLEEFTDNLEDTELHASANSSQNSDSERHT